MKLNKKGIELPINFMIIIGLAVLVLIAVTFLFLRAQAGGDRALDLNSAITECKTACSVDSTKIKASGVCPGGTCNFSTAQTSKFLGLSFIIDDVSTPCLDIDDCQISVSGGGTCRLNHTIVDCPP